MILVVTTNKDCSSRYIPNKLGIKLNRLMGSDWSAYNTKVSYQVYGIADNIRNYIRNIR